MAVLTTPVSDKQEAFIEELVESGRAANKSHAVRMAIDAFAREHFLEETRQAHQEIREGKGLKGDLDKLVKRFKA